ncbi:MAG: protein phosphatase 2C domain-containing protein [Deltaproteobacteria bacterium]|nr:protein phosphatase 2C domain-containing protein [Deltaproteobacteria bacterium]
MTLAERFVAASGSIVGREHVRLHRNNQDAVAVRAEDDRIVLVVADGCSSAAFSEVGARLGAIWLAAHTPALADRSDEEVMREASDGLAAYLDRVLADLGPAPTAELALFTFLVAILEPGRSIVFGVGDGVVSVNGSPTILDPGPCNAPRYLAYGLFPGMAWPAPEIHHSGPTDEIDSLLIGTDGVADCLAELSIDAPFEKNPSLLGKQLVVLGERGRKLADDTSVALVRRRVT